MLPSYPGQPYPESAPWLDLRPYLNETWQSGGTAWHFRGMISGNTCTLHLRTRNGTTPTIAAELPEEFRPAGQITLQGFSRAAGRPPIGFFLETSGHLHVSPTGEGITDGMLWDLLLQGSYMRGS